MAVTTSGLGAHVLWHCLTLTLIATITVATWVAQYTTHAVSIEAVSGFEAAKKVYTTSPTNQI